MRWGFESTRMKVLFSRPFEGCCGGRILGGFGYCNDNPEEYSVDDIESDVKAFVGCIKASYAFGVAVLTHSQRWTVEPILIRNGFERVVTAQSDYSPELSIYVVSAYKVEKPSPPDPFEPYRDEDDDYYDE